MNLLEIQETQFKRPKSMEDLFENDPLGLLDNVGEKRASMTFSDKISAEFKEFADFVKGHGRLPSKDSDDFDEELLAIRFDELSKESPEGRAYCESLVPGHEIEKSQIIARRRVTKDKEISKHVSEMQTRFYGSIDDAFNDDPLGLLNDVGDDPAEHEYWRDEPSKTQSASADQELAKAKECKDFYRYEHFFDEINEFLKKGHLEVKNIVGDHGSVSVGDIFVIRGVMSLISFLDEKNVFKDSSGRKQQRVRQIMENGKESNPFNTSLRAAFYKENLECRRVVGKDTRGNEYLRQLKSQLIELENGSGNSVLSGYIYILSTKSQNPVIRKLLEESSLIKIGYTTTDVSKRIANAENETTYLCAGVNVLKTFACYNFDARELEDVLHTLLAEHCLNVELSDRNGRKYRPHEWFTINAETATEIVQHIFTQDIDEYYIDPIQGKLRRKQGLG